MLFSPHFHKHNPDHRPEPDPSDPRLVRYGKGRHRVSQKVRRYLRTYRPPYWNKRTIEAAARRYELAHVPRTLFLARTAHEMERVYEEGPRSCMRRDRGFIQTVEHPVRAYAAGDLAVAYVTADNRTGGNILARCIVWPARKRRTAKSYGDRDLMGEVLRREGYVTRRGAALDGARLSKVPCKQGAAWLMPHVDEVCVAVERGGHFVLAAERGLPREKPFYNCNAVAGWVCVDSKEVLCGSCGNYANFVEDSERLTTYDGVIGCIHCISLCSGCQRRFARGDTWPVGDAEGFGLRMCGECLPDDLLDCPAGCQMRFTCEEALASMTYRCVIRGEVRMSCCGGRAWERR